MSRVVCGHWRLGNWQMDKAELLNHTKAMIDLGITSFDHADIYGDYSCEKFFGEALALEKGIREKIQIITKCGIMLISKKYPERKIKHYDYRYEHILHSVENSLRHLNTSFIDMLLLHRPAPFFNAQEVARAFYDLKKSGKVLHFGVSNFTPLQFDCLQSVVDVSTPLVANQIEISPYCLEHFDNENLTFLGKKGIVPMAWSPLAGGKLFNLTDEKSLRIQKVLKELAEKYSVKNIETIAYAWLFAHPSKIVPIIGSKHIERTKIAIDAMDVFLSVEDWYQIYSASKNSFVP